MKRVSLYSIAILGVSTMVFGPVAPPVFVMSVSAQQPLVSGQRVRVKKMARDMTNVRQSIVITGPSQFQSNTVVTKYQKRIRQFADALERYPQVGDPDVKAARSEYQLLRQALSAEFKRAQAQTAKTGDVQAALKLIETNGRKYAVPKPLTSPFSDADAKAWVKAGSDARTVSEHNIKQLAVIAQNAYLPKNRGTVQSGAPYDKDDVNRLQRWATKMSDGVQGEYKSMSNTLAGQMRDIENELGHRWQAKPDSDDRWKYIGEGQAGEANAYFTKSLAIAKSSVFLERALNREPAQALKTIKAIETAQSSFSNNAKIALDTSRPPKAKSKNRKMTKIAGQVLDIPRYKFGKHGPIVLTTPKITEHERKDSEIEIDDVEFTLGDKVKLKGTKTTWTYKWKEFKFAVPLKDDTNGNWYIWWITAKNYSSGSSITPMNQWISGKATKGSQILETNF